MRRTRELPASATRIVLFKPMATPTGEEKEAFMPMPSLNLLKPSPASVVTTRPGEILRMRWLPESATYTLPYASTATPVGELNEAPTPTPSSHRPTSEKPSSYVKPSPASVLAAPPGVILRMRWPSRFAAKILPLASTATP
jgi:hypothetical protein